MSDELFPDFPDRDHTVMRPRPGGRQMGTARSAAIGGAAAEPLPQGLGEALPLVGINPLVKAASPLLAAAIRLRGRLNHTDPGSLRRHIADAMSQFEQRAIATGLDKKSLRAARYALCATIDDLVLSTPWGSNSVWASQSLTSMFHNEVWGGERFFEILEGLQKELGTHRDVVELMFLCVSLGFEGQYRALPRGSESLAGVRDNLYQLLRQNRPGFEAELSPHWRGLSGGYDPLRQRVPLWVVAVAAASLAAMIYFGFILALGSGADTTAGRLAGLQPLGRVAVPRISPAVLPAAKPLPPIPNAPPSRLESFLAQDRRDNLVEVIDDPQAITVRIANRTMFASGDAVLNGIYLPLLDRIGTALQGEPGKILVIGHTDSQPIHTPRFPSNTELSEARAQTVARIIGAKLSDPNRIRAEGHADRDDTAESNATVGGRQLNRRTDIVVIKPPARP